MENGKLWWSALGLALLVLFGTPREITAAETDLEELKSQGSQWVQEGKWPEAQKVYEQLTRAEPENPQHWAFLGLTYRNQEQFEMAKAAYERALNLDESSIRALAGMAVVLEQTGKVDRAFEFLTRAAREGLSPQLLQQGAPFETLRKHPQFAEVLKVAERAANPCVHEDPYDDFDFWVGDWDVHVGGQKRAQNLITKEMNGCIIRERYHNNFGYEGESINYYDPETGKWKQNWVDKQGGVVRYTGELKQEGVMVMEGANTSADGKTQLARVTWTLLPDGRVHHVIMQSTDGGKNWQTYFDGIYIKSDRTAETKP